MFNTKCPRCGSSLIVEGQTVTHFWGYLQKDGTVRQKFEGQSFNLVEKAIVCCPLCSFTAPLSDQKINTHPVRELGSARVLDAAAD